MSHKRKSRTTHAGTPERILRSFFSIIVLSALVLGISYFVREISSFNTEKAYDLAEPVLSKAGVDEEDLGKVAGIFSKRVSPGAFDSVSSYKEGSGSNAISDSGEEESDIAAEGDEDLKKQKALDYTLAIMSDSHNYNGLLKRALELAKERGVGTVFYLGDFTDWGDISSLQNAKQIMDTSGMTYYAIPGDHDTAQFLDTSNFEQVFGKTNHDVEIQGRKFIMFNNSANKTAISDEQMAWFEDQLIDTDFILLSQPLYHPVNDRVMGILDGEEIKLVKEQADQILKLVVESEVKAVIAGDQHNSSINPDPNRSDLEHVVVGALTQTRNMQFPRFSLMNFYTDGSYDFEEVVLE